jgi:hypothetical protein
VDKYPTVICGFSLGFVDSNDVAVTSIELDEIRFLVFLSDFSALIF